MAAANERVEQSIDRAQRVLSFERIFTLSRGIGVRCDVVARAVGPIEANEITFARSNGN
jgi:hypothetical protein